jgi:hypothetical protein
MKTIRLNEETLENIAGLLKQELDDMEGERERRDEEFTQGENTIFVEYDVTAHRQEEEGGSDDYGNYEQISFYEHDGSELVSVTAYDKDGDEITIENIEDIKQ